LALWLAGARYFFIVFIVLSVCLFIIPPDRLYPFIQKVFRLQLKIMGLALDVIVPENFDRDGKYIIMGNHESLFDIFAVPAAVPVRFVAVEADFHFRAPLWGSLIKRWGCVSLERPNLGKAIDSLKAAEKIAASGTSVLIMPEGGRTLTGEMKEFKKGPFHLALAAKRDILPFAVKGLYEYNRKGSLMVQPGTATIRFGDAIPYSDFRGLSVEELRDLVRDRIMDLKNM